MLGVAMATHAPAVGNRCPVVIPRMAAASVQSIADPRLTLLCTKLMGLGYHAGKIIEELETSDPNAPLRQVGVVDAWGNAAAFTGAENGAYAGHILGEGWLVMGNGVVGPQVTEAMAASPCGRPVANSSRSAWCARSRRAGAPAGRPTGTSPHRSWSIGDEPFAYIDLRVDVHEEPIGELRRIFEWFRPLLPYYSERPYNPRLPRDDRWRDQQRLKGRGVAIDLLGVRMRRLLKNVLAAALAVTAGASAAHAQKDKDMLVVGASLFTDSIAPTGGAYITLSLCYQTWEPLVARDGEDKLVPALAERWEALSPTHWRFHLRKGVKWHDGTPFTAADVKYTIDYVIDPKQVYARKTRIAGVTGAEIVDEMTVDIQHRHAGAAAAARPGRHPDRIEGPHREGRPGRGAQEADGHRPVEVSSNGSPATATTWSPTTTTGAARRR